MKQTHFDFATVGKFGKHRLERRDLKEWKKRVNRRAAELRAVSRVREDEK